MLRSREVVSRSEGRPARALVLFALPAVRRGLACSHMPSGGGIDIEYRTATAGTHPHHGPPCRLASSGNREGRWLSIATPCPRVVLAPLEVRVESNCAQACVRSCLWF